MAGTCLLCIFLGLRQLHVSLAVGALELALCWKGVACALQSMTCVLNSCNSCSDSIGMAVKWRCAQQPAAHVNMCWFPAAWLTSKTCGRSAHD
jgi:hypothetical protein